MIDDGDIDLPGPDWDSDIDEDDGDVIVTILPPRFTVTFVSGVFGTGADVVWNDVPRGTIIGTSAGFTTVPTFSPVTALWSFGSWAASNPVGHEVTANVTFTARWNPIITIEVDEDGDITVIAPPEVDYTLGTDADGNPTVTFPENPDYDVVIDDGDIDLPGPDWDSDIDEDDGDVIVTILPPRFTVTFQSGVFGTGADVVWNDVPRGTIIGTSAGFTTIPTFGPVTALWSFGSWAASNPVGHEVTANVTFTARWNPIITIEVDEDGDITVIAPPEVEYNIDEDNDGNPTVTFPENPDYDVVIDDGDIDLPGPDWDSDIDEDDGDVIVTILPPRFNINYSFAPGINGPLQRTGLLAETYGLSSAVPTRVAEYMDASDETPTAIRFVGWSATPFDPSNILALGDALPPRVTQVTITNADVTVYAIWGWDANGSGGPDILERGRIYYDLNGGNIGTGPIPNPAYVLAGDGILLDMTPPTHSPVNGRNVVFAGWSSERVGIWDVNDPRPTLITSVNVAADGYARVYAVWSFSSIITIDVDDDRNVDVDNVPGGNYNVDNYGPGTDGDIIVTLPEGTNPDHIVVNHPDDWTWDYDIDEDTGEVIVVITPPMVIEILTPTDVGDGLAGFTILRGVWAEETAATISFLVRINNSVERDAFISRLGRMSFTAASSQGFQTRAGTATPGLILTHDSLAITADNIGDVVEIDGVEYREVNLQVTNTLKSGIVDFTLNFATANNLEVLETAIHRVLIPGDINKDAQVNSLDHAGIFSIMRGETEMPARMSVGHYVFELADVNGDGQINSLDHSIIFNMMRGNSPTN